MKLKLIRSGGLMGKPVTAEEDLSSYPISLLQRLEQVFAGKGNTGQGTLEPGNTGRDQFQYFAEFNGKRLRLEELEAINELLPLVKRLKERLQY